MAILDGAFEAIEELEQTGLVRVHTDIGVVCGIITGSFPTADAAFDRDRNALELALRVDEEIRLALADVVPAIVADENLTKLRVDNVMDLETPKPYNLIHGQGVFRVAGFNMVLDDVGSTVHLTDRHGVTFEVVVDEVLSKQLFKGHTASLLEPGDYKLVVKSRAGDAEGPLQTAFRKVKYLKVEPPVQAPTVTSGSFATELTVGSEWSCDGTHLKGCKVHLVWADETTGETKVDKTLVESHEGEDTHFAITLTAEDVAEFDNVIVVKLTFTNAAGSDYANVMLDKGT